MPDLAAYSRVAADTTAPARVLFADVFAHSMNPTHALMGPMAVAAARDVRFFGPGFSTAQELDAGLLAFAERTGPYDVVMTGPAVALFATTPAQRDISANYWTRYAALSSAKMRVRAFYDDIVTALPRLPVRMRIATLLSFDYYAATTRHTDILEALDTYVLASDAKFVPTVDELPDWAWQEKHFQRKRHMIGSAWHAFLARRADRVLSLPHFIADQEFSFRALEDRRQRISVPGVEYVMRSRGLEALRARGIRPAQKKFFKLFNAANKLGLPMFSRFVPLRAYNMAYLADLMDSRFVYTAPEGFGIAVRKFFEICAAGAVMLCVPPHGFAALGFRHGEHHVELMPEGLPDALAALEADPARAQAIAAAGRKLVFERHSLRARGGQLAACLAAMADGTFAGSTWEQGEFLVRRAAPKLRPQPADAAQPNSATQ
jgi:hypothetical protein